ncbi:MAG TPA: tetratricopeptide repeat protein [Gemmatimonadaceae bacterium]|nr:tetratricopeptide repeat protein [Gemmatimonadaceae bacterium]
MPFLRYALAGALALAAAAAPAALAQQPAAPAGARTGGTNIERLERQRRASPGSVGVLRALGVAYYRAGRYADARTTLEQARRISPRDGLVALYLGMSAELSGDLPAARDAYASYIRTGRTGRTKQQVKARLAALQRQELLASAKQAVAQESQLAQQPTSPTTIAVLPLRFSGNDSTLLPLERGLADLLVTDLGRSSRLTIVERDRMQALVDELKLSQAGRVDSTTSVRGGRIVRAGRVVQGGIVELPNRAVNVNAAIIDVPTTQAVGSVRGDDRLEQLFTLEKRIAFGLFDELGVTLSAQERVLVEQRPTRSLAAFLAYSGGLMAEDNGNLDQASRYFGEALRLDPNFTAARQHQENVEAAQQGASVTTAVIEATVVGSGVEGSIINAANRGLPGEGNPLAGTITQVVNDLNPSIGVQMEGGTTEATQPSNRDPASSAAGTDQPAGGTGRISIIIKQPGRSVVAAPAKGGRQ